MREIGGVAYLGEGAGGGGGPLWLLAVVGDDARSFPVLVLQLPDQEQYQAILSRVRTAGVERIRADQWSTFNLPPSQLRMSVIDGAVVEVYTGRHRLHPSEPQALTPSWWETAEKAGRWAGFFLVPPGALDSHDASAEDFAPFDALTEYVARREVYGAQARVVDGPLR